MKATPLLLLLVLAEVPALDAVAQRPPQQPQQHSRRAPPAVELDMPDCTAMGALPDSWSGQAFAIDGDTLMGVGIKPHIRLWGIEAPELRDGAKTDTVPGMRARAALADLLGKSDHKLKCRMARFDRECRAVAKCSLDAGAESIDVGGALISAGMAYGFALGETLAFEPRASQRYADAELEARKARRGLWPEWLGEK